MSEVVTAPQREVVTTPKLNRLWVTGILPIKEDVERIQDVLGGTTVGIDGIISSVQSDLAEVIFQLALQNLLDMSGIDNIVVDTFDSANAVNIISGVFSGGKVYI